MSGQTEAPDVPTTRELVRRALDGIDGLREDMREHKKETAALRHEFNKLAIEDVRRNAYLAGAKFTLVTLGAVAGTAISAVGAKVMDWLK